MSSPAITNVSDYLLVPMNVQALVINGPVLNETVFHGTQMSYANLAMFESPAPRPFDQTATEPTPGIHLHWDLPAAFKHAADAATMEFPHVPNRWLVLRFWPGTGTQPRQVKAWIVLSDALGDPAGSPYVHPYSSVAGAAVPTTVGASELLTAWAGEKDSPLAPFLKAVGPGDVSFASFQPNVKNVFSLVDDAKDNQGQPLLREVDQTITLSYLVVGWFSDATVEPLANATTPTTWADTMGRLKWLASSAPYAIHAVNPIARTVAVRGYGDVSARFAAGSVVKVIDSDGNDGTYTVTDTAPYARPTDTVTFTVDRPFTGRRGLGYVTPASAPATWPTRTLTHGLLKDVLWQNKNAPARPNKLGPEISRNVQLAVGNSSIDALAAMVSHQGRKFLTPYPIATVDAAARTLTLAIATDLGDWFPNGSLFSVQDPQRKIDVGSFHVSRATYDGTHFTIYTQEPIGSSVQPGYVAIASGLEAESLEAFQYNLLATIDQPGGAAQLDMQLRRPWFGEAPGGTVWKLVAAQRADTTATNDAPVPNDAQRQWLAHVNLTQDNLDRETRVLHSMQDELYALWWKNQIIENRVPPYRPENTRHFPDAVWNRIRSRIVDELPKKAAAVATQQAAVDAWQQQFETLVQHPPSATNANRVVIAIDTPLARNPAAALELKETHLPRFHHPNDPVILLSGLNPSVDLTNPTLIGQQYLRCRFASETVSGLVVAGGPTISAAQVRPLIALPDGAQLPTGVNALVQSLAIESTLLNASNAPLLAGSGDPAVIASAIRVGHSFAGLPPDESARTLWQQSWIPLFIDWNVSWFPTVNATKTDIGQGPWLFDQADWRFDGLDFQWQGGDVTAPDSLGRISFPIHAADPATNTFTLRGAGNVSGVLIDSGAFTIEGSSRNNGNYKVESTRFNDPDFVVVVAKETPIPSATADGRISVATHLGAGSNGVEYAGRTFLTPKATFNFRSRLEQYLATQQHTADPQHLREVEHLIDMIGGKRLPITAITATAPFALKVASQVDLTHLFAVDSTCYVVVSAVNDGTYTVAGTSYDGAIFTVVVQEPLSAVSPDLGELVPSPQQWDFLSQSLTGFTDRLIMRSLEQNVPPSGTSGRLDIAKLVNQQNRGVPDVGPGDAGSRTSGPPYFFPVRGGFFLLHDLYLVDRFGQSINLLFANGNDATAFPEDAWKKFQPIRSRWLTPAPNETTTWNAPERLLKLPPRLVADTRLDFRFVSAPDTPSATTPADVDVDLLAGSDPVCGWLLPNHLDRGLGVYDANGELLGEVLLRELPPDNSGAVTNTTIDWYPAPMSAAPIVDAAHIPNPQLARVLGGLFSLPPQGGVDVRGRAFDGLLKAIDETLWTVDPLGARDDQNLSVFVGRPIAVVRARLRLTLAGHAPPDQTTTNSSPVTYLISGVDPNTRSFSVAPMSVDLSARFPIGGICAVADSTGNNGEYHIVNTAFSPADQRFTVVVQESFTNATGGGSIIAPQPTGGIEALTFPIRLGRADLYDDGLMGYFVGDDFQHYNNVHDPEDYTPVGYLRPIGQDGNYVALTPYAESAHGGPPTVAPVPTAVPGSVFITMLLDPRGAVHATSGLLPMSTLALPSQYYVEPLSRMSVTFRTGPLLVDPQLIRMPRPSERSGRWSWLQKNSTDTSLASWEEDPLGKETAQARLTDTPLVLRDGWMKLTAADLEPTPTPASDGAAPKT